MPAQNYLLRPTVVQAIWWDGTNTDEVNQFLEQNQNSWRIVQDDSGEFMLRGPGGVQHPISNSWFTSSGLNLDDAQFQEKYVPGTMWVVAQ
ncbi:MAG: hypothetical protein QJR12_16895 [Mycobacterium sp.]|uniref:hypothetical protein n=1 Tax=Mycobacterium sp. TaxID=1785 RepID=UPI0026189EA0|nr:hypothetical protein [Mycobacterium sp.]MDI3315885.1 hypothetical protein [Mycobacterium sp.]